MNQAPAKLLEVVALLHDRAQDRLVAGQVGTIVEVHPGDGYEVEFLDLAGDTVALLTLKRADFLVLRHDVASAA